MYAQDDARSFEQADVVLIEEFRSCVNNEGGYVLELPGGSSHDASDDSQSVAVAEVHEETGMTTTLQRITFTTIA